MEPHPAITSTWPASRVPYFWLVAAILVVGFALRVIGLAHECPCLDEADGILPLNAPTFHSYFKEAMEVHGAPHPPGYFALLYYWSKWVGTEPIRLRLLSVFFGLAAIPWVFILGRRLYGPPIALLATAIFAVSPYEIYYSQEVRPYCVLPLLGLLSVYGFVAGLESGKPGYWLLNLVANLCLCSCHMFATLLPVAEACYLFLFFRDRKWLLCWWGALHLSFMVAYLYWISTLHLHTVMVIGTEAQLPGLAEQILKLAILAITMAGGIARRQSLDFDMSYPTSGDLLLFVTVLLLFRYFLIRTARVWFAHRQTLRSSGTASREDGEFSRAAHPADPTSRIHATALLSMWLAIPPLVIILGDSIWVQFFRIRYFVECSPALYILLAAALCSVASKRWRAWLLVLLAMLYAYEVGMAKTCPMRADWKTASEYVLEHRQPGEAVVVSPGMFGGIIRLVSKLPYEDLTRMPDFRFMYDLAGICAKQKPFWAMSLSLIMAQQGLEDALRQVGYDFKLHVVAGSPTISVYYLTPRQLN